MFVDVLVGVSVGVIVIVGVLLGVTVSVGVYVDVLVAVLVAHDGCEKVSFRPELTLAVLHENCVYMMPMPFCTPVVAPLPAVATLP